MACLLRPDAAPVRATATRSAVELSGPERLAVKRYDLQCGVRAKVKLSQLRVTIRRVAGGGAAAGEITNVSHVFQPEGRSEAPNSA
jgi:hypothetical protein